MQAFVCTLPTLAISTIYCLWHLQVARARRRERVLRERVTYMLWVMAQSSDRNELVLVSDR